MRNLCYTLLILLAVAYPSHASQFPPLHSYHLTLETVVGQHIIPSGVKAENEYPTQTQSQQEEEDVVYSRFVVLATNIAKGIIHLYSNATLTRPSQMIVNKNDEMQHDCVKTILGGGRCNLDYGRKGEVMIQVVVSFIPSQALDDNAAAADDDSSSGTETTVHVEADMTAANTTARNVLIESVPFICKRLDCQQDMQWSIAQRRRDAKSLQVDHTLSLEKMLLERFELGDRVRLAMLEKTTVSSSTHSTNIATIEVWQHTEGQAMVQSLFIDGYLQSTTHVSGSAHAEALVHPALISVMGVPDSIVVIAREPTAILKEILKHERIVKSIFLLGVDVDAVELATKYLASNNDCSFMKRAVTACLSQPNVHLVTEDVLEWLSHQASTSQMIADVVLVDVPPETDELISPIVQTKLRAILSDESVLVVACGSAPPIADAYELDARHSFLQHVSALPELGGLDYYNVFVYDEPLASPLASSFFVMFPDDSDTLTKFIRANIAAIENDIVKYFHHTTNGSLTRVYDGATHAGYHRPSKAWQHWRCVTPPSNQLYECTTFLKHWYNRDRHFYKTEVVRDPVKGRSLVAVEDIPKGYFVLPDDPSSGLRIDHDQWEALNEFIDQFPDAEIYRKVRDFVVAYGFHADAMGQSGWCVSIANNSTFTNHACTEYSANVKYVDEVYFAESQRDDVYLRFSPFQVRYADLVGVLTRATRDIKAGEEIQMDYHVFRNGEEKFHNDLLRQICNSGVGMVGPNEGDVLLGYERDKSEGDGDEL